MYYTNACSCAALQLLRHHTGPVIINMHTEVNSTTIHNLTKQKLSKHFQRQPHHAKLTDELFWKIHKRIEIGEIN